DLRRRRLLRAHALAQKREHHDRPHERRHREHDRREERKDGEKKKDLERRRDARAVDQTFRELGAVHPTFPARRFFNPETCPSISVASTATIVAAFARRARASCASPSSTTGRRSTTSLVSAAILRAASEPGVPAEPALPSVNDLRMW